jgi:hypothetical protein
VPLRRLLEQQAVRPTSRVLFVVSAASRSGSPAPIVSVLTPGVRKETHVSDNDNEACPTCGRSDSLNFRTVREGKEAAEAALADARQHLLRNAVEMAGFTPNDNGEFEGVAGLLVKEYTTMIGDGLPSKQGFLDLANRYGVSATTPSDDGHTTSETVQQIASLQSVGDQIRAASQPPAATTPGLPEQIQQAQAEGDWDKARLLSHRLVLSQLGD